MSLKIVFPPKKPFTKSGFFGHFEKNSRPKKLKLKKNSSKFSKNSSKSFKNSIICQLKTDFLLQKVPKLIYVAQKFAQTSVFLLNEAQNWKIKEFWKKIPLF